MGIVILSTDFHLFVEYRVIPHCGNVFIPLRLCFTSHCYYTIIVGLFQAVYVCYFSVYGFRFVRRHKAVRGERAR